ncbi:unnamed protein product [Durusdinium trenchii]|uniref:Glutamate synthase (NADPH) n=1 Tax=Durusdinium trenchii TaxID=1381693 RepID=A0ABP0JKE7_9DINO
MSGGTGAAKWGSIKHCGLPWEIGLAETHQTLVLNGLRNRVTLQTDGQVRTGRDVVIAAMLGAEEIAMTTAPLITLGCIMMRKCHLNTCPVGVATQDPELRAKFTGQPEHLINFLFMVAEEAREIMASLGIKKFNDLIGRTDLLRPKGYLKDNPKTADLDFADLLKPAWTMESMMGNSADNPMFCCEPQDHELAHALDQSLVSRCSNALTEARGENQVRLKSVPINNVDRSVGGILSFEVSKKFGAEGLPEGSLHIGFLGSSGQSFGNFLAPGITFELEGDANDYIGKGLSGGTIIVYKPKQADYDSKEAIIAGNAALYGATSGKAFFGGIAAERFAVRNSGATAVCEGVGDHGCEYMTRGTVVVLGQMGQNFAAGMSGGVAFVLDLQEKLCNVGGVHLEKMEEEEDKTLLKSLVSEHAKLTGSKVAEELLKKWPDALKRFTKVFPKEYKKALLAMKEKEKASAAPKEPLRPKSGTMDVEEAGGRPTRVQNPDKKKGFHEYERKAMPYRDHKDRHMDWEEVYASQSSKSQQWHNWMQTQTARCMDCGTPTCHSPNQGGGGCPLGNRIPTWNQLVHEGEWKRALERLLDTNNFPEFTGTTCPAPCEEACVLGINEKPVAIKTTELAIIEYGFSKGWIKPQPPRSRTGRRVCIIGSGPAGLAAAQQLNRVGHLVEVIERADRAGGLLMYGIPSMKLDKIEKVMRRIKLLQQDAQSLQSERRSHSGHGRHHVARHALDRRTAPGEHRAGGRFVGGATQRKNLDTAMGAPKSDVPSWDVQDKRVIVIGGGDTAVDCVGTAIRLGAKSVLQFSRRDEAPAGGVGSAVHFMAALSAALAGCASARHVGRRAEGGTVAVGRDKRPLLRKGSRVRLLVDADSSGPDKIKQAISCLEEQAAQVVETQVFAEPGRKKQKAMKELLSTPGLNIKFCSVPRLHQKQLEEANDDAMISEMRELARRPQVDCVALLTEDSGFAATIKSLESRAKFLVLMSSRKAAVVRFYEAEGIRILELPPTESCTKVRAVLDVHGNGSVHLAEPYDQLLYFAQAEQHAKDCFEFFHQHTGRNNLSLSDFFLGHVVPKIWLANGLGRLVVFPSQMALAALHNAINERPEWRWNLEIARLAYFLPMTNLRNAKNVQDRDTYGSSLASAIFRAGGPFMLNDSEDLAIRALRRLGYIDDSLNADPDEALFVFINSSVNKDEMFSAMKELARMDQLEEMGTFNGLAFRILQHEHSAHPQRPIQAHTMALLGGALVDTYRVDYAHSEGQAALGRDPREYLVQTKSFRASSKERLRLRLGGAGRCRTVPDEEDPSVVGAVVASKLTPSGKADRRSPPAPTDGGRRAKPQSERESGVIDYPAELVVLAMGFTGPDKVVDPQNQLARDQNSNYKATYGEYQAEEAPWSNLYACGDCRRGASLVVTAIAEGRDCAARVDAMLMGSTSLPRAAPLAANPTFYQMPQKWQRGKEPEAEGNLEARNGRRWRWECGTRLTEMDTGEDLE